MSILFFGLLKVFNINRVLIHFFYNLLKKIELWGGEGEENNIMLHLGDKCLNIILN